MKKEEEIKFIKLDMKAKRLFKNLKYKIKIKTQSLIPKQTTCDCWVCGGNNPI